MVFDTILSVQYRETFIVDDLKLTTYNNKSLLLLIKFVQYMATYIVSILKLCTFIIKLLHSSRFAHTNRGLAPLLVAEM